MGILRFIGNDLKWGRLVECGILNSSPFCKTLNWNCFTQRFYLLTDTFGTHIQLLIHIPALYWWYSLLLITSEGESLTSGHYKKNGGTWGMIFTIKQWKEFVWLSYSVFWTCHFTSSDIHIFSSVRKSIWGVMFKKMMLWRQWFTRFLSGRFAILLWQHKWG
jgi:hypothetical protein